MEMEVVKRCAPFCERTCKAEHHPLLVAFVNCSSSDVTDTKRDEIVKLLDQQKSAGCEVILDPDPNYRFPPVLWACALGNGSLVRLVLDHGYLATCQYSGNGDTGLHRALFCLPLTATQKGAISRFKGLLPLMKDSLLLKNKDGFNVFILACKNYDDDVMMSYHLGIVTEIIEFAKGKLALLRSLLTSTTNDGQTALHILAKHDRNSRLLKKLIDSRCADLTIKDAAGCTPTDIAVCSGQHLNATYLYAKMKKMSDDQQTSGAETHFGSGDAVNSTIANLALSKELLSPRTPRTIKAPSHFYETSPKSEKGTASPMKSKDTEMVKSPKSEKDAPAMKSGDTETVKSHDSPPTLSTSEKDTPPMKSSDTETEKSHDSPPTLSKSEKDTPAMKSSDTEKSHYSPPTLSKSEKDTPAMKSSDTETVKSHDSPPTLSCDNRKSADVVIKLCDVSSLKSCDISHVKSCDRDVVACVIEKATLHDIVPGECVNVKSSHVSNVASCDNAVTSCDVSPVRSCDTSPIESCVTKSCDTLPVVSCDVSTVVSCDTKSKLKELAFPRVSKRLLNKPVTEAVPERSIQLSKPNNSSKKIYISMLPDITKMKNNLNTSFNMFNTERRKRQPLKRTFSENGAFTETGNKIDSHSKNTPKLTAIRAKRPRLIDGNMNTVSKDTSVCKLTSMPVQQLSSDVVDVSATPKTDASERMEVPEVKAIWNTYIKYCAKKMPKSADFILHLPTAKLLDAFTICPGLRDVLIQHVESSSLTQCGFSPEVLDVLYMPESEMKEMLLIENEVLLNSSRHSSMGPAESSVAPSSVPDTTTNTGVQIGATMDETVEENMDDLDLCDNVCLDYLDDTVVNIEREVLENDARQKLLQEDQETSGRRENIHTDVDNIIVGRSNGMETTCGDLSEPVTNANRVEMDEQSRPGLLIESTTINNGNKCNMKTKTVKKVKRHSKNMAAESKAAGDGIYKHQSDRNQLDASNVDQSDIDQRCRKQNSNKFEFKIDTITDSKTERQSGVVLKNGEKKKSSVTDDHKTSHIDGALTLAEHSYMKTGSVDTTSVDKDIEMEDDDLMENQTNNIKTNLETGTHSVENQTSNMKTNSGSETHSMENQTSNIQTNSGSETHSMENQTSNIKTNSVSETHSMENQTSNIKTNSGSETHSMENQTSNIKTSSETETQSSAESQPDNNGEQNDRNETLTLILPDGISTVVLVKNGRKIIIKV